MTGKIVKKIIFTSFIFFIINIFCLSSLSYAVLNNPNQSVKSNKSKKRKADFAKGRFIVKYKDDSAQVSEEDAPQRTKELNKKFKVKNFKKVSKFTKEERLAMKQLRLAQRSHKKGRRVADIPDLSSTFVAEVDENADIESIVEEYQSDPSVEFAQPD